MNFLHYETITLSKLYLAGGGFSVLTEFLLENPPDQIQMTVIANFEKTNYMIIYNTKIYSKKGKSALEKSLTERLLNLDNPPIYIFPFCLFSRSFYKDNAAFIGKISNGEFDLDTRSKLIATRTRLPISLKGAIKDNEIEIKYQIPTVVILIFLSCFIVDLFFVTNPSNLDNVFYFIAGLFVVRYLFMITKIQSIFKNICKADTLHNVQTLTK